MTWNMRTKYYGKKYSNICYSFVGRLLVYLNTGVHTSLRLKKMMKEIVDNLFYIVDELVIFCGVSKRNNYCRFNGGRAYRVLNDLKWFVG